MSNDFKKEIVDHALQSVGNLELAIKVATAFEDIKKQLIKNFAELLADTLLVRLQENLPGNEWIIISNTLATKPFDECSCLIIKNKNWPESLEVGIEAGRKNSKFFAFCIFGKESAILTKDKLNQIKTKLQNEIGAERISESQDIVWQRMVGADLKDWDNEEALLKLKNGEALSYFIGELVSISNIVNSICNSTQII